MKVEYREWTIDSHPNKVGHHWHSWCEVERPPWEDEDDDVFVLPEGTSHDLHNSGGEDLRVIAFFSKPQVEQHWDVETWPPDDSGVTGSPNRG